MPVFVRMLEDRYLAVESILDLLAASQSDPGLTRDDILACLAYASHLAHEYRAYPLPV